MASKQTKRNTTARRGRRKPKPELAAQWSIVPVSYTHLDVYKRQSMYQSSVVISGYFWPTSWHRRRNLPSVAFTILALVTMDTRLLWFLWA